MRLTAIVAGMALAGAGCGGGSPDTEFQAALEGLGDGVAPTGVGFGWSDGTGAEWQADALGPAADDLLDEAAVISRGTGFDPRQASEAISIGGSFAYGVRFDETDPGRLPELLKGAGAKTKESGEWTLYDLGEQAEGVTEGPLLPLGALASRVAIGPAGVVLARFDDARSSLIDEEGSAEALEAPTVKAATDCLGEVVAARTVPGAFTHAQIASPELIAMGVAGQGREILCAVDDSEPVADRQAAALRRALAPDATDEITGEPVAREIAEASISTEDVVGVHVARAELDLAAGTPPGVLFGAFVRGSLLTYLGAGRPIPRD